MARQREATADEECTSRPCFMYTLAQFLYGDSSAHAVDIKAKTYIMCVIFGCLQTSMLLQDLDPATQNLLFLPWNYFGILFAALETALFCALTSRLRPSEPWALSVLIGKCFLCAMHVCFWGYYRENELPGPNFALLCFALLAYMDMAATFLLKEGKKSGERERSWVMVD